MPFPQRQVTPVRLSCQPMPDSISNELECVSNRTLCDAMRQLASLLRTADDIFEDLSTECGTISTRTTNMKLKMERIQVNIEKSNPKKAKIPESDLQTFSKLKVHYKTDYGCSTNLFTKDTRPNALAKMYKDAGEDRGDAVHRDDIALVCVPVLAADTVKRRRKKDLNLDIETRRPASWVELPSWHQDQTETDSFMQLPTPAQRVKAAQVETEVVPVNVSGANFQRMAEFRRSLQKVTYRKKKKRRERDRRNTLAGGENSELRQAVKRHNTRSKSTELMRKEGESRSTTPGDVNISMDVDGNSSTTTRTITDVDGLSFASSYANTTDKTMSDILLPPLLPEGKTMAELQKIRSLGRRQKERNPFVDEEGDSDDKNPFFQHQNPFLMEDDGASTIYSEKDNERENYYDTLRNQKTVPLLSVGDCLVSTHRAEIHPDGALSSSGVWTNSGSGGSDKEDLVNSTINEDTTPRVLVRPKSSLSMGVISESSDAESTEHPEQTLTVPDIPFVDEEEECNSSVYSCDTEGYYTTFHDFNGFKEVADQLKLKLSIDEEDEEKKEGTPVIYRKKKEKPPPPRRYSSLEKDKDRKSTDTVIHVTNAEVITITNDLDVKVKDDNCNLFADDTFETSFADWEFSESDMEALEQSSRMREKTLMRAQHIPALCIITPVPSETDDEAKKSQLNDTRSRSETPEKNTDISSDGAETASPPETTNMSGNENTSPFESTNVYGKPIEQSLQLSLTVVTSADIKQETLAPLNSFRSEHSEEKEEASGDTEISDKIVSITPDIVKPVKECLSVSPSTDIAQQINDASLAIKGRSASEQTPSSSSGTNRLPDMLSNTPDGCQIHDVTLSENYYPEQSMSNGKTGEQPTNVSRDLGAATNPHRHGSSGTTAHGSSGSTSAADDAPVTSSEETGEDRVAAAVTTQPAIEQPKLRITSPFKTDQTDLNKPPPAILPGQGVQERRHISPELGSEHNLVQEKRQISSELGTVHNLVQEKKQNTPELGTVHNWDYIYNEVNGNLPTPSETYEISGGMMGQQRCEVQSSSVISGNEGQRMKKERSKVTRSDSYRQAKPVISSPNLNRNGNGVVKSPSDTSIQLDCSSINLEDDDSLSSKSSSKNFFKNIRSNFSFSSLRRKSPKKTFKRNDMFAEEPRMTSTPVSKEERQFHPVENQPITKSNFNTSNNHHHVRTASGRPSSLSVSSEWSESPRSTKSPENAPKFKTRAMYDQHLQRRSIAEAQPANGSSAYGYIYPNQNYITPANLNQFPHHHHYGGHQSVIGQYGNPYGSHGPASGRRAFGVSQRSSVASMAAFEQGLCIHNPNLSFYEDPDEGAYGYSIPCRQSPHRSPNHPTSHTNHQHISPKQQHISPNQKYIKPNHPHMLINHSHLSPNQQAIPHPQPAQKKSCPCPMCYHSLKNPCESCGCPSSTVPRAMKLNSHPRHLRPAITDQQSAVAFFSPSSDYYSLSPDSPPLPLQKPQQQPHNSQLSPQTINDLYAKVNKSPKVIPSHVSSSKLPIPSTESPVQATKSPVSSSISPATSSISPATSTKSPVPSTEHSNQPLYMSSQQIEAMYSPKQPRQTPSPFLNTSGDSLSSRASPTESVTSTHSSQSQQPGPNPKAPHGGTRKPLMPDIKPRDTDRSNRRHSWAGDKRNPNNSKPTSLNDFKKLLSQQSPNSDPHSRLSARELLDNSSPNKESQKSSQRQGGSLRNRTSPWNKNRFSVIEEEAELEDNRKSRESLLNKK